MRFVILSMFLCELAMPATVIRNTATTNLPATYNGAGAISLSSAHGKGWSVINNTAVDVYVCLSSVAAAPTCPDTEHYVPASSFVFRDGYPLSTNMYVRGVSVISTGIVEVIAGTNN